MNEKKMVVIRDALPGVGNGLLLSIAGDEPSRA